MRSITIKLIQQNKSFFLSDRWSNDKDVFPLLVFWNTDCWCLQYLRRSSTFREINRRRQHLSKSPRIHLTAALNLSDMSSTIFFFKALAQWQTHIITIFPCTLMLYAVTLYIICSSNDLHSPSACPKASLSIPADLIAGVDAHWANRSKWCMEQRCLQLHDARKVLRSLVLVI